LIRQNKFDGPLVFEIGILNAGNATQNLAQSCLAMEACLSSDYVEAIYIKPKIEQEMTI